LTGVGGSIVAGPGVGIPATLIALTGGVINAVNAAVENPAAVIGAVMGGGGGGKGCP